MSNMLIKRYCCGSHVEYANCSFCRAELAPVSALILVIDYFTAINTKFAWFCPM